MVNHGQARTYYSTSNAYAKSKRRISILEAFTRARRRLVPHHPATISEHLAGSHHELLDRSDAREWVNLSHRHPPLLPRPPELHSPAPTILPTTPAPRKEEGSGALDQMPWVRCRVPKHGGMIKKARNNNNPLSRISSHQKDSA